MTVKAIAVLGQHELDYPRNRTIKNAFQKLGFKIFEIHSRIPFPQRHLSLLKQFFKVYKKVEIIWVTEGGHRFVPLFRLVSFFTNHKIIFDPFTSRYNTRIEDRMLYKPKSLQGLICLWQDWSACKSAHTLVFDTLEHKEYFYKKYKLNKPYQIIPVLIPEENFVSKVKSVNHFNNKTNILFYGTFIPLQGIQTIIEAGRLAKDSPNFKFSIIGKGQTHKEMQSLANGLENIEFIDTVSEIELADYIEKADICLGIFGDTTKASRVVPNKVIQCASMSKPIITRESKAIKTYFENQISIYMIKPNSAIELYNAINTISQSSKLQQDLSTNSRLVFEKSFSQSAVLQKLKTLISNGTIQDAQR
jgi:glycosyltransferase involved in cell wall biosynthesis